MQIKRAALLRSTIVGVALLATSVGLGIYITEASGAIRKPTCNFYAFAPDGGGLLWATVDNSRDDGTVFYDIPAEDGWNFSVICTVPGMYNGQAIGRIDYMVFEKS